MAHWFELRLAAMDYQLGYDQGVQDARQDDVETLDPAHVGPDYVMGYTAGVARVRGAE